MSNPLLHFFIVTVAGWLSRHQAAQLSYLREENRVLKEQFGNRRLRLTDAQRRRLAAKARVLGRRALLEVATIVTPETLMKWYRRLIARKYDGTRQRGPGRPRTPKAIAALVVRLATDNPTWGYTRIRGGLAALGHKVGRTTIARILAHDPIGARVELDPTAGLNKRKPRPRGQADAPTKTTLVGHVFFAIDLKSRRVEIAGIAAEPHEAWMKNVVRGLTDAFDGFLVDMKYLILDRDPVFTKDVRKMFGREGVKVVRLPARSPNLNAFAERFIGSVRRECLSKVIPLGERHLRQILQEYIEHYHTERPHQGLGNRLLEPVVAANGVGPVECTERLGGTLKFYSRAA